MSTLLDANFLGEEKKGILADLPETQVIYIPILNTSNRPDAVGLIEDANNRVREYTDSNARVTVLDIGPAQVDENGDTRPEFLTGDGSHYTEAAYEAMAQVVKPVLEKIWSYIPK